ncbi:hypothetical protein ACFLSJ_04845 [Verrucomicrobiota bacterium]
MNASGRLVAVTMLVGAVLLAPVGNLCQAQDGPWQGASDLGGGWHWLDWFGSFWASDTHDWVYHNELGWMYTFGSTTSDLVFWQLLMGDLWWTSDSAYPFAYRFSDAAWLWYVRDSASPCWFYNLTAGTWESHPASGPADRLEPSNFTYQGAFALPSDFDWGARGACYYGAGNSGAGSLLITGPESRPAEFAEVAIPTPVTAATWEELPVASQLTAMVSFDGNLIESQLDSTTTFGSGIEVVPMRGSQTGDKLYGAADQWYEVSGDTFPTIWFSEMDGSNPRGLFHVGPEAEPYHGNKSGCFLFSVPQSYADAYLGGRTLVTGKSRGAFNGSMGPALIAFRPWDNEAPSGDLDAVPMAWYRIIYPDCAGPNVGDPVNCDYPDFTMCDEWVGGGFVEAGQRQAVILLGTKGLGTNGYGPGGAGDCNPYQGYHCDPFERQVVFFDVNELADVASGTRDAWTVVPYTIWRPAEFFLGDAQGQTCGLTGGIAVDTAGNRVFMIEKGLGGDNAAAVHVWTVAE